MERFEQDQQKILGEEVVIGDEDLDAALLTADERIRKIREDKPAQVDDGYFARLGAAMAHRERAKDQAQGATIVTRRPDPVGRLFALWEGYFPENTAENQMKFTEFRWDGSESLSALFVRLQQLTEQLKGQLGEDAINGPEARRKFRSAVKEMGSKLYDLLTQRIMEDERNKVISPLRMIVDYIQ